VSELGIVHSVNANSAGGVPKPPVGKALLLTGGVEGDKQRDLKYHGGPARAVCLFSLEKIAALRGEGHPIDVGTTGENLTIEGLDWDSLEGGQEYSIGDAVIFSRENKQTARAGPP
jgi:MOSC domain-containing protein YiiM